MDGRDTEHGKRSAAFDAKLEADGDEVWRIPDCHELEDLPFPSPDILYVEVTQLRSLPKPTRKEAPARDEDAHPVPEMSPPRMTLSQPGSLPSPPASTPKAPQRLRVPDSDDDEVDDDPAREFRAQLAAPPPPRRPLASQQAPVHTPPRSQEQGLRQPREQKLPKSWKDEDRCRNDNELSRESTSKLKARFGDSQATPPDLAVLTGRDLLELRVSRKPLVPTTTKFGLSKQTRVKHAATLEEIQNSIRNNPALQKAPLGVAIVRALENRCVQRGWSAATTAREFGNTYGAFAALSQYTNSSWDLHLRCSSVWKHAQRRADTAKREAEGLDSIAAASEDVQRTTTSFLDANKKASAAALWLCWIVAGRMGDVQQLERKDLVFGSEDKLSVTMRRGKTVAVRGPYTVHTTTGKFSRQLKEYVESKNPDERLFPHQLLKFQKQLREALKRVSPELTLRSLRRGALQAMALQGTSAATLMSYSGHTREDTLKRYLNWGRLFGVARTAGFSAGRLLSGPARA